MKPQLESESDLVSHRAYQELFQRLRSERPAPRARGGYFAPPSQPQLLEKLEHLSRYSQLVLVVTGVSGVGKSALLKAFFPGEDDASVHACCLSGKERLGISDLLSSLVEQLELDLLPTASDEDKLEAIFAHAELLRDISRLFLVVVDDAEKLSLDALDLLLNLLAQTDDPNAAPHLVLFGSPRLNDLLQEPRFRHLHTGGGHHIELQPFSYEATLAYLRHRLGAGFDELSPRQLQQIHHSSFGLPGRINKVLGGVRDNPAAGESRRWLTLRLPRVHLWLAGVVIATVGLGVGGLSLWEVGGDLASSSETVRLTLPRLAESVEEGREPESLVPVLTLSEKLAREEARLAGAAKPLEAPESEAENLATIKVAPLKQPEPDQPVAEKQSGAAPSAPGTLVLEPPPPPPSPSSKPAVDVSASDSLVVSRSTRPASKPTSASAPVSEPLHPLRRDQALLSWPRTYYTLQVLGARQAKSAVEFIQSQRRSEDFYYFATLYKGKPWHVVVYGRYASRDEAVASVPGLPTGLRKLKPWARSVAGVQDDIRRQE